MRKLIVLVLLCLFVSVSYAQKYASGKWAKLIDKRFVQYNELKELKGYTEQIFTALTLDTPSLCITIYKKDTTCIILMTYLEDGIQTITDVLEVKGVKKNQQFLISQCTVNGEVIGDLIVLVQNPPRNSLKAKPIKAWRADRDKTHFKKAHIEKLTCLFEDP